MAERDYRQNLTLDDLDEYGCLKISFGLWIVIVYLCRHLVLLILGATSSLANFTYGQLGASYSVIYSHPWFLAASAPAVAVLLAAIRRSPSAPAVIRNLWRVGAPLLVAAAVLDLAILGALLGLGGVSIKTSHFFQAFVDVICLVYLTRTRRVRDTFADFPSAQDKKDFRG